MLDSFAVMLGLSLLAGLIGYGVAWAIITVWNWWKDGADSF